MAHQAGVYPSFYSMKRLAVFLLYSPLDGMLVHRRASHTMDRINRSEQSTIIHSILLAGTNLYTWRVAL